MSDIEALLPLTCPHCGENVVVKLKVIPPEILQVLKAAEVEDVIKKLTEESNDTPEEPASA